MGIEASPHQIDDALYELMRDMVLCEFRPAREWLAPHPRGAVPLTDEQASDTYRHVTGGQRL